MSNYYTTTPSVHFVDGFDEWQQTSLLNVATGETLEVVNESQEIDCQDQGPNCSMMGSATLLDDDDLFDEDFEELFSVEDWQEIPIYTHASTLDGLNLPAKESRLAISDAAGFMMMDQPSNIPRDLLEETGNESSSSSSSSSSSFLDSLLEQNQRTLQGLQEQQEAAKRPATVKSKVSSLLDSLLLQNEGMLQHLQKEEEEKATEEAKRDTGVAVPMANKEHSILDLWIGHNKKRNLTNLTKDNEGSTNNTGDLFFDSPRPAKSRRLEMTKEKRWSSKPCFTVPVQAISSSDGSLFDDVTMMVARSQGRNDTPELIVPNGFSLSLTPIQEQKEIIEIE